MSRRERLLWTSAAAVAVAIFATLGLTGVIADELRDRNLLDNTFFALFLVLIAAIGALGLGLRPRGIEIGALVGIAVVYGMALARMAIPEERSHLIEYGLLAVLVLEALSEAEARRSLPAPSWLLAFAGTSIVGVADELVQLIIPSRVFDVVDIGFNVLASAMGVLAIVVLRVARGIRLRRRR